MIVLNRGLFMPELVVWDSLYEHQLDTTAYNRYQQLILYAGLSTYLTVCTEAMHK